MQECELCMYVDLVTTTVRLWANEWVWLKIANERRLSPRSIVDHGYGLNEYNGTAAPNAALGEV